MENTMGAVWRLLHVVTEINPKFHQIPHGTNNRKLIYFICFVATFVIISDPLISKWPFDISLSDPLLNNGVSDPLHQWN